jgi:hypothetical protein
MFLQTIYFLIEFRLKFLLGAVHLLLQLPHFRLVRRFQCLVNIVVLISTVTFRHWKIIFRSLTLLRMDSFN